MPIRQKVAIELANASKAPVRCLWTAFGACETVCWIVYMLLLEDDRP